MRGNLGLARIGLSTQVGSGACHLQGNDKGIDWMLALALPGWLSRLFLALETERTHGRGVQARASNRKVLPWDQLRTSSVSRPLDMLG